MDAEAGCVSSTWASPPPTASTTARRSRRSTTRHPQLHGPELHAARPPASEQTDLYAVASPSELLTRKYPYGEIEPFQTPVPATRCPTRYSPRHPAWLESVLLKAVARDPRPASRPPRSSSSPSNAAPTAPRRAAQSRRLLTRPAARLKLLAARITGRPAWPPSCWYVEGPGHAEPPQSSLTSRPRQSGSCGDEIGLTLLMGGKGNSGAVKKVHWPERIQACVSPG